MALSHTTEMTTDYARQALCQAITHSCERGASSIQVRINTSPDAPQDVSLFDRVDGDWKKAETIVGAEFAESIQNELERLAACPHSDESQVRRKNFSDRAEFDLKFHHDKVLAHRGANLYSYLFGVLFRER
jgi:hypothetical protein